MGSENGGELRGWGRVEEAGREGTKRLPNGQYIPTPLVHGTRRWRAPKHTASAQILVAVAPPGLPSISTTTAP